MSSSIDSRRGASARRYADARTGDARRTVRAWNPGSPGAAPVLVDAHVHLYDCFPMARFFDAAYANFEKAAAGSLGCSSFQAVMVLADWARQDWFDRLTHLSTRSSEKIGGWSFHPTGEDISLRAEHTARVRDSRGASP